MVARETDPLLSSAAGGATKAVDDDGGRHNTSTTKTKSSPAADDAIPSDYYRNTTVLNRLVFGWLGPLLTLGNTKDQLQPEDVKAFPLLPEDETERVWTDFETRWEDELLRGAKKHTSSPSVGGPSLVRALFLAFGRDFLSAGFLKAINDVLQFVGPQVLHGLIRFLSDASAPLSSGLWLTAAVTLAQLGMSLSLRHYFFRCYRTGLRLRTAVVMGVYRKALVLSSKERQSRSAGEITNLMSIDAQRLQDICTYLHAVWYSFLQIGLAVYFLWGQLGPSCLAGVAVMVVSIPLTGLVAKSMQGLQKKLMKAKDERVKVNNEVLGSMKVIKLQAWEQPFQDRIMSLRNTELSHLFKYLVGRLFSYVLFSSVPLLVALATFAAYTLSGNVLDVAEALTALALFAILRFPLFMLPNVINSIIEAMVAINRIESFLLAEESVPVDSAGLGPGVVVAIDNATFVHDSKREAAPSDYVDGASKELSDTQWEIRLLRAQLSDAEGEIRDLMKKENIADGSSHSEAEEEVQASDNLLSLRRVNFECKEGELIAVVGAVGAGKSTLINSILGEVRPISGRVSVKSGKIGYFAQSPFILNDTLRQNVLFSSPADRPNLTRYKQALDVCALTPDLVILPKGELCEIGEKGITLSGGQKARVGLARAVYHDADLYLLDDPLAAVDAHVGKHIFEKCIIGELLHRKGSIWSKSDANKHKKSAVVLITNALQYLNNPAVSRIVVLKNGSVAEVGTYKELTTDPRKKVFRALLSSFEQSLSDKGTDGAGHPNVDGDADLLVSEHKESRGGRVMPPRFFPTPLVRDISRRRSVATPRELVVPPIDLGSVPRPTKQKRRSLSITATAVDTVITDEIGLTADEFAEREVGGVKLNLYFYWARSAGGVWVALVLLMFYAFSKLVNIATQWWLTYWSDNSDGSGEMWFFAVYAIINLSAIVIIVLRQLLGVVCGLRSARTLFSNMLDATLKSPMSFFDTTPLGQIVNRFSKDVYTIDEVLMGTFQMYLSTMVDVVGVIATICWVTPVFAACLLPILLFYRAQQSYFTRTYREVKRMDSVSRSPIYALFSETLDGLNTIRAFAVGSYLSRRMTGMLDFQQTCYFLTFTAQCWLGVRLELVGSLIIAFACLCSVLQHNTKGGDETFAGLAGLGISFALSVTQSLNWSVRMASDLEANMVAVERIQAYCKLDSEAPRTVDADNDIEPKWPSKGVIEFRNAQMRYRPGLPLVLKGLNLVIPGHSKVGIVGRTGAGKSTLMAALLRIVELDSGSIVIDGVNIGTVGLQKLRSQIAVIPQDPVLFSGSIRTNLDPFNEYEDKMLCDALIHVGLMQSSSSDGGLGAVSSLADEVREGGENFSVGQRQLLCFARALLCGSSIVIMDEATAAVDVETDARIQAVLRKEFKDVTCLTVAHRLNTIMDSDLILVMDNGRAAEFDTPSTLLRRGGVFKDLVDAHEKSHKH